MNFCTARCMLKGFDARVLADDGVDIDDASLVSGEQLRQLSVETLVLRSERVALRLEVLLLVDRLLQVALQLCSLLTEQQQVLISS